MKRLMLTAALIGAASSSALVAQLTQAVPGQGPMPGRAAMGPRAGRGALDDPASFLLAQTGELKLTDAQVSRLAAIARRSAERRRSLRSQVDSMRPRRAFGQRADSATRERMRQQFEQMRPNIQRMRDQTQADRRDAIAVLTPEQQAIAWERVAMMGQMRRSVVGRGGAARGFGPARPGLRGGIVPNGPRRAPAPRRRPDDQ